MSFVLPELGQIWCRLSICIVPHQSVLVTRVRLHLLASPLRNWCELGGETLKLCVSVRVIGSHNHVPVVGGSERWIVG